MPTSAPTSSAAPIAPASAAINLEDFDAEQGGDLRELKQLRAARWHELCGKLARGEEDPVLERKISGLEALISQLQTRIGARLAKQGRYLLTEHVARDLATAADLIRQMGESDCRRLLELVPDLLSTNHASIQAGVRRLASDRARVLRPCTNSPRPPTRSSSSSARSL